MNTIQSIVQYYPSRWALGGAAMCGIVAVEMAFRAIQSSWKNEWKGVSENLGGAIFFGLCATNVVPFSTVIGGGGFTLWALLSYPNPDLCMSGKVIAEIFEWAVKPFWNHGVVPLSKWLWNHIITPVAKTIMALVEKILGIFHLPSHPVWYGLAILVIAIVVTKGLPPLGGHSIAFRSPVVLS